MLDPTTSPLLIIFVVLAIVILWLYRENVKFTSRFRVLDVYSKDLTAMARKGLLDPVIGRDHEIERVLQILSRRTKNNPLLVGKSGVGKTAIVEGLAQKIASGNVPIPLLKKRVVALDLSGLVAGTKYRGEFEKRLKSLVDEIIAAQRTIILFVDEIHSLAEAGEATGAINAADILKPALARGELQVVGATTYEDYNSYVQKDSTLARRFQPVTIEEPTKEQTFSILQGIRKRYEAHHNVRISDEALKRAIELADKYLKVRVFPDKAIDLIDEASAKVRLAALEQKPTAKPLAVSGKDVDAIMEEWRTEWTEKLGSQQTT